MLARSAQASPYHLDRSKTATVGHEAGVNNELAVAHPKDRNVLPEGVATVAPAAKAATAGGLASSGGVEDTSAANTDGATAADSPREGNVTEKVVCVCDAGRDRKIWVIQPWPKL